MSTPAAIAGHYRATRYNGEAVALPVTLVLSATGDDRVKVHARVANTLNGEWTFADGVYKGMLISTLMMGPEPLMQMERLLAEGSSEGITVTKKRNTLTLSHGTNTMVFEAK